jgi:hypothetical protein
MILREDFVPSILNVCIAHDADVSITFEGAKMLFKDGSPRIRYKKERVITDLNSDITIGDLASLFNLNETQVIDSVMENACSLKNFLYCNEKLNLYKDVWDLDDFLGVKCSEVPLFMLDYLEKTPFVFSLTVQNACDLYFHLAEKAVILNQTLKAQNTCATEYYMKIIVESEMKSISVSSSLECLFEKVDDFKIQNCLKMMEFRDLKVSRSDYDKFDSQKEAISDMDNRHVLALLKENYAYLDKLGLSYGEMSRMRNLIYEYTCEDVSVLKLLFNVGITSHVGVAQHFIRIYMSGYRPEIRKGVSSVVSVRFKLLLYNRHCDFLGVLSDHYTSMLPLLKDSRGYYFEYDCSIMQTSDIRVEDVKYVFNYMNFDMPGSCISYHVEHLYSNDVRYWDLSLERYSIHGSNMTIAPFNDFLFRKPDKNILSDLSLLATFMTYYTRMNNYGKVQIMVHDSLAYSYISIGDLIYDKKYFTYDKNGCVYLRLGDIT